MATVTQVLEIASFELIPLGELMEYVFEFPEDDGENVDDAFAGIGFESYYTMINLGSFPVIFVFSVTIPVVLILLFKPLKGRSRYARDQH